MYAKNTKRFMLIFNIWTDRIFHEENKSLIQKRNVGNMLV